MDELEQRRLLAQSKADQAWAFIAEKEELIDVLAQVGPVTEELFNLSRRLAYLVSGEIKHRRAEAQRT